MALLSLFDIHNTLVTIPIGTGYDMSWIEAIGTLFGLLCIWYASKEKIINYPFGLINVLLFAIIFYQIQLYAMLLLQVFFFIANLYGWHAWTHPDANGARLEVRWMTPVKLVVTLLICVVCIALVTLYIDPVFTALARVTIATFNLFGGHLALPIPEPDAYPLWDAAITVLSIVAQILMTRKYVENWILWVIINVISVGIYSVEGVYALSIEYVILFFIAANGVREWVQTARQAEQSKTQELRV